MKTTTMFLKVKGDRTCNSMSMLDFNRKTIVLSNSLYSEFMNGSAIVISNTSFLSTNNPNEFIINFSSNIVFERADANLIVGDSCV